MKNSSQNEIDGRFRRWWSAARALLRWKVLLCVILDHDMQHEKVSPDSNRAVQRFCGRCGLEERTRNPDGTGGWYWRHRVLPDEDYAGPPRST